MLVSSEYYYYLAIIINQQIEILFFGFFILISYILVFNRLQKKTNTVISILAGKVFDNIKHLYLIKTFHNLGTEGTFLQPD